MIGESLGGPIILELCYNHKNLHKHTLHIQNVCGPHTLMCESLCVHVCKYL